jgi:hypothetical protein
VVSSVSEKHVFLFYTLKIQASCSPTKPHSVIFFYGATARYRALASLIKPLHSRLDSRFWDTYIFYSERSSASHPTPNLEDQGISFSSDLSGMGGPTSSYATAGIALRAIWPHKPCHYGGHSVSTGNYSLNPFIPFDIMQPCKWVPLYPVNSMPVLTTYRWGHFFWSCYHPFTWPSIFLLSETLLYTVRSTIEETDF